MVLDHVFEAKIHNDAPESLRILMRQSLPLERDAEAESDRGQELSEHSSIVRC